MLNCMTNVLVIKDNSKKEIAWRAIALEIGSSGEKSTRVDQVPKPLTIMGNRRNQVTYNHTM